MSRDYNKRIWKYTADDEEPICGRCDYFYSDGDLCGSLCGPENWWNLYCRSEFIEEEPEVIKEDWALF